MAHKIRLPLLLVLGLVGMFVLSTPAPVQGAPTCDTTEGHFSGCNDIYGIQSSTCGEQIYCKYGWICFEWDCVLNEHGAMEVVNVYTNGPNYCFCTPYAMKCC
jgi:hypothetical protein